MTLNILDKLAAFQYQAGMKDIRRGYYFLREEHHDALRYRRSNYPNGPVMTEALFEQVRQLRQLRKLAKNARK